MTTQKDIKTLIANGYGALAIVSSEENIKSYDEKVAKAQSDAFDRAQKIQQQLRVILKDEPGIVTAELKTEIDKYGAAYKRGGDIMENVNEARRERKANTDKANGDAAGAKFEAAAAKAGKDVRGLLVSAKETVTGWFSDEPEVEAAVSKNKKEVAASPAPATGEPAEKDSGVDFKGLAGGIGGGLLGYLAGTMFGEGMIGKIAGILLAFGGYFMGRNLVNKYFGGGDKKDAAQAKPQTGGAVADAGLSTKQQPSLYPDKPTLLTDEQFAVLLKTEARLDAEDAARGMNVNPGDSLRSSLPMGGYGPRPAGQFRS